jgi:hypothetical protein
MPLSYEEAQIKSGLSYEDATQQEYHTPPSLARSASDWATSVIRGLAKGAIGLAGLPGDLGEYVGAGVKMAGHAVGLPDPPADADKPRLTSPKTSAQLNSALGDKSKGLAEVVTGQPQRNAVGKFLDKKPETKGGEYLESIGEFAPGAAFGGGGVVRKGLSALMGGAGSQAAADLAKAIGIGHEDAARFIGGLLSGAVGSDRIPARNKAMVRTLRQEGVEPTAGDITGSKALKYAEHRLGTAPGSGGAYEEAREKIGKQYTKAVLKRVGEAADEASPEVVDRAFTRIGKSFDDLSARNTAQYDRQFGGDIHNVLDEYEHLFHDANRRSIVAHAVGGVPGKPVMSTEPLEPRTIAQKVITGIEDDILNKHMMTGEQYQARVSKLDRIRRGYKNDPELQDFFGDLRRAYDDLMERNIAQSNPSDLGKWKEARRQYRNMLVVEKAASGAGEDAAHGIISPAKLRQAVVSQGKRGYARGQGDFASLARAGEGVMKPPPTSGTGEGAHAIAAAASPIAALGAMFGGHPEAAPWLAAAPWAPGIAGRAIMSRPSQWWLKNAGVPSGTDALARSFLAAKAADQ